MTTMNPTTMSPTFFNKTFPGPPLNKKTYTKIIYLMTIIEKFY